jgi:hypothetical protein
VYQGEVTREDRGPEQTGLDRVTKAPPHESGEQVSGGTIKCSAQAGAGSGAVGSCQDPACGVHAHVRTSEDRSQPRPGSAAARVAGGSVEAAGTPHEEGKGCGQAGGGEGADGVVLANPRVAEMLLRAVWQGGVGGVEDGGAGVWIGIFVTDGVGLPVLPGVRSAVTSSDPAVRLLVRRSVESHGACLGVCAPSGDGWQQQQQQHRSVMSLADVAQHERGCHRYGCLVYMTESVCYSGDGRGLSVGVRGLQRFVVMERQVRDGYQIARVVWVGDDEVCKGEETGGERDGGTGGRGETLVGREGGGGASLLLQQLDALRALGKEDPLS